MAEYYRRGAALYNFGNAPNTGSSFPCVLLGGETTASMHGNLPPSVRTELVPILVCSSNAEFSIFRVLLNDGSVEYLGLPAMQRTAPSLLAGFLAAKQEANKLVFCDDEESEEQLPTGDRKRSRVLGQEYEVEFDLQQETAYGWLESRQSAPLEQMGSPSPPTAELPSQRAAQPAVEFDLLEESAEWLIESLMRSPSPPIAELHPPPKVDRNWLFNFLAKKDNMQMRVQFEAAASLPAFQMGDSTPMGGTGAPLETDNQGCDALSLGNTCKLCKVCLACRRVRLTQAILRQGGKHCKCTTCKKQTKKRWNDTHKDRAR